MSSSSSYTHPPTDTDIVSVSALHLTATVGPDHWHRTRPQPVHLTVHLHLTPSYLNTPGQSDNVTDSLHYGHLVKAVETRVGKRSELASTHEEKEEDRGYASARALVEDVTDAAFEFVRDAVGRAGQTRSAMEAMIHAVRVVLELPKQILLARGFEIDLVTRASDWLSRSARGSGSGLGSGSGSTAGAVVRVRDLILPVLIGVNPPERLAKQHVITHLTFFEAPHTNIADVPGPQGAPAPEAMMEIDYPSIVQQIATDVQVSAYLTLEKLVHEIIRTAYRALDAHPSSNAYDASRIDAITVRCQKPSALSFADASGVEMTRTREALGFVGGCRRSVGFGGVQ